MKIKLKIEILKEKKMMFEEEKNYFVLVLVFFKVYVIPRVPMGSLKICQPIWSSRLASYSKHN